MQLLTPHSIARPLDVIQAWRLPDQADATGLGRCLAQTLGALDALSQLELALEVPALGAVSDPASADFELVRGLLLCAERTLGGLPHLLRIDRLRCLSPDLALEVERRGGEALRHVRGLRRRVDFIRGQAPEQGFDFEPLQPTEERARPLQATLQ